MSERWKHKPEHSNWGAFGADDELGRANFLTPQKVLQGVAEVKAGMNFCLSLPLEYPGGSKLNARRTPPVLEPTHRGEIPFYTYPVSLDNPQFTDVICDDKVVLSTQYSTQWDSLAHVGSQFDADGDGEAEIRFYNGWQGGVDIIGPMDFDQEGNRRPRSEGMGARRLGIENLAVQGMQGRGVMVDLQRHFGREHKYVGYADWMGCLEANGVMVEKGDMLCIYTGFADLLLEMGGNPDAETLHHSCAVLDGRDEALQQWVIESGVATISADNYAVEGHPAQAGTGHSHAMLPLHELCLFKLGVNLGELWYFQELNAWLKANHRTRFFLTAPPLRLTGGVGSPLTPIGTV